MRVIATTLFAALAAGLTGCDDEIFGPLTGGQECDPCSEDADCDQSIGLMCIVFPDQMLRCAFAPSGCGVTLRIEPGPETTASGELSWAAAADFDGDGATDLAVIPEALDQCGIEVRLTAAPDRRVTITLRDQPSALAAADVDGDGNADLVSVSASASSMAFHGGNGDGSFDTFVPIALGVAADVLVVADVDGDDRLDVVAGSTTSRRIVTAVQRDGVLVFGIAGRVRSGLSFDRLLLRDANGDGNVDLFAYDTRTRHHEPFRGQGDGVFAPR